MRSIDLGKGDLSTPSPYLRVASDAHPRLPPVNLLKYVPTEASTLWRIRELNPSEILGANEATTPSSPIPLFKTVYSDGALPLVSPFDSGYHSLGGSDF